MDVILIYNSRTYIFRWLKSRQNDDNAEGLWRVNDKLYELGGFIDTHPGGREWLQLTKGTDITESFEVHHIYMARVETVLAKFYVRDAKAPRNVRLTFHETGFYRTLKRRIGEKLLTIDRRPEFHTKVKEPQIARSCFVLFALTQLFHKQLTIDVLLLATFALLFAAVRLHSYTAILLPSLTGALTTIAAHNYFHQRDNFRMRYFNLLGLSYKEWRISHAMSHHLYPNSLLDLEVSMFEPFLCWVTNARTKNLLQRYGSWLYQPFLYGLLIIVQVVQRVVFTVLDGRNLFQASDAIPLAVPAFMYAVSDGAPGSLAMVLGMWALLLVGASFYFGLVGLNAGHHNHHVVHDGDVLRADQQLDWGLYTMDTVIENSDTKGAVLALTHFGHHALHHLLPTVDHGLLPQLYPVLYETLRDFDTELNEFPWFFHICGQLLQLARVRPTDYTQRLRMRLAYAVRGTI